MDFLIFCFVVILCFFVYVFFQVIKLRVGRKIAYLKNEKILRGYAHTLRNDTDDPQSKAMLGLLYETGRGVKQDNEEAFKLFRLAAEQGHTSAMLKMAYMYSDGRGVPQSDADAFKWFKLALDLGDNTAQTKLAHMYSNGIGVAQDYNEAFRLYKLAADKGDDNAEIALSVMYQDGSGVTQNDIEAFKWAKLSANQGNRLAQHVIAYMYFEGRGVQKNDEEAFKWFKLALDQGDDTVKLQVALMYSNGIGVVQDCKKAFGLYKSAAEKGDVNAEAHLSLMYRDGSGVKQNDTKAFEWAKLSADKGHKIAQSTVALMYLEGRGVPQNNDEAFKYFQLAGDQDDANNESHLSFLHQSRSDVSQNAIAGFKQAALSADQDNATKEDALNCLCKDEISGQKVWFSNVLKSDATYWINYELFVEDKIDSQFLLQYSHILSQKERQETENTSNYADLARKYRFKSKLAPEYVPTRFYKMPETPLTCNKSIFMGTGQFIFINQKSAEILQQYNLGNTDIIKLDPCDAISGDRIESDCSFYLLNIVETNEYCNVEKSINIRWRKNFHKVLIPAEKMDIVEDGFVIDSAILETGLDLWADSRLEQSFFISNRLKKALDDAGIAQDWLLTRCVIEDV